jgi:hypothetical protein
LVTHPSLARALVDQQQNQALHDLPKRDTSGTL